MLYNVNEFTFDLPGALKDRTINVFALSDNEPGDFALVVTRSTLLDGEDVETFTTRQLRQFGETLSGFELQQRAPLMVSKTVPATFLDFKWISQGKAVHQRQVAFLAEEKGQNRKIAMIVTATCKGEFTAEWSQAFEQAVGSIELRP